MDFYCHAGIGKYPRHKRHEEDPDQEVGEAPLKRLQPTFTMARPGSSFRPVVDKEL